MTYHRLLVFLAGLNAGAAMMALAGGVAVWPGAFGFVWCAYLAYLSRNDG